MFSLGFGHSIIKKKDVRCEKNDVFIGKRHVQWLSIIYNLNVKYETNGYNGKFQPIFANNKRRKFLWIISIDSYRFTSEIFSLALKSWTKNWQFLSVSVD